MGADITDYSSTHRPNKSSGTTRATKAPGHNRTRRGVQRLRRHDDRRIGALSITVLLLVGRAFIAVARVFGCIITSEDLE